MGVCTNFHLEFMQTTDMIEKDFLIGQLYYTPFCHDSSSENLRFMVCVIRSKYETLGTYVVRLKSVKEELKNFK